MIRLADAITNRFPQGNPWATDALAALSGGLEPTTLVHEVVEGWTRRGEGDGARLVDTLFVLTSDRLGLGHAGADAGEPRWIPLRSVIAVDAVDNSPLPLQTIELEIGEPSVVCVGWPESFSDKLVGVLVSLANGEDPDGVTPPEPAAPLPEVAAPPPPPAPLQRPPMPAPPEPHPIVAALDFLNKPVRAPEPGVLGRVDVPAFDAPAFDAPAFDAPPVAEPVAPEPMAAPQPIPAAAPQPMATPQALGAVGPDVAAPWLQPGMVWPEALRGVLYLGGHPGYPRKRKNGTMVFSPNGLDVSGTGFQSWDMSMDWAFVHGLEIQGPDEIMFGDHLKIDSTSSALIVTMTDDTRMFFEIRTRRPPSLRAMLAPVLTMVENIRSHRATR